MDNLIRSADLWFSDGSVILRAENTLFRVYSGLLAQHLPVFKDLFTLPQPLDDETFEGCPVVTLQDNAVELRELLKVVHDWRCVILTFCLQ